MRKHSSVIVIILVAAAGLYGLIDLGTESASATFVQGPQFDGSGGPWNLAGSPYIVKGDVTVPGGQTLTIEPGVDVRFDGFFGIYVDGNLSAIGDPLNRINVTSNLSSPISGDWFGIQVNSSGHLELAYANVTFGKYSVFLNSTSRNNVTRNVISTCMLYCIMLSGSSNNTIEENTILFSNIYGISIGASNYNTLIMNTLSLGWGGVHISGSHNEILNNTITENVADGLVFMDSSENNVTSNVVSGNAGIGILINFSSDMNTLKKNRLSNNGWGIVVNSSSGNMIHHNILDDNVVQAMDDSNGNEWNDSYPSGGNYWSNYSPFCQEFYNGSATPQTTGAPDGICDLQYDIDLDSADFYPLKSTVSIDAPPETEVWEPGGIQGQVHVQGGIVDITWLAFDDFTLPPNPINISYGSPSDGWTPIANNEANDGLYSWDTSSVLCPRTYWVRLSVYDTIGQTTFDTSNESFSFMCPGDSPPIIDAYEPGGSAGQAYTRADIVPITWRAFDDNPLPPNPINISYGSILLGWIPIATFEQDDGLYLWDTSSVVCNQTYDFNITVFDSSSQFTYDISNSSFAILCVDPLPQINVYEPGATFSQKHTQGDNISVTWKATDNNVLPPSPINITYGDDVAGWTTIATDEPNDEIYFWNTTLVPCPGIYWMNLSVYDSAGQEVFDEANNSFNLFCPGDSQPIVVAYGPGADAGQTILQGDVVEVTWWAVDDNTLPSNPINISFGSATSGWTDVATDELNDGYFSWDTSSVPCPGTYWMNISVRDTIGQMAYDEGNYSFEVTCPVTTGGFYGIVEDSNGDPISGALVTVLNSTGAIVNTTSTNATGGFNFTDVTEGLYNLTIAKEYYLNGSVGPFMVVASSFIGVGIAVLETNATVRGRVVDEDGNPIASAEVQIIDSNSLVIGNTTTDANGNFSFHGLDYGLHRLWAGAEGYVSELLDSFTIDRFNLNVTRPDLVLIVPYMPPLPEEPYDWTPLILGVLLVVILLIALILFLIKRRQKDEEEVEDSEDDSPDEGTESDDESGDEEWGIEEDEEDLEE